MNGIPSETDREVDAVDSKQRLTTREVAEMFRCTDRTIRNWVKDGRLQALRIGHTVRFRREDVEALGGDHD